MHLVQCMKPLDSLLVAICVVTEHSTHDRAAICSLFEPQAWRCTTMKAHYYKELLSQTDILRCWKQAMREP